MPNNEFEWDFKEESSQFEVLAEGDYRVRIEDAQKAVSQSGNQMLTLKLTISGGATMFHNIVFLKDKPEITNRNLTSMFDSFGIEKGNFILASYKGKVGAAHIYIDEYQGEKRNKIKYFIFKNKQDNLPVWAEKAKKVAPPSPTGDSGYVELSADDELPF